MLQFNQRLNKALSVISALVMIVMMLHIVAHALGRFLFDAPIYGTLEIVEFWYLPMVVLLGIPAAQLQNEQITVTLAIERMNHRTAIVFKIFACVLGGLVSLGFALFGLAEARENMEMGLTAGVLQILTWPVYFLVPLVFVLLAILYVIDIAMILKSGEPEVDLVTGERVGQSIENSVV